MTNKTTIPAPCNPETLAVALAPLAKLAPSRTETILALVKKESDEALTPVKPDLSWLDETG